MKVGLVLFKQADCLSSRRNVQIIASSELLMKEHSQNVICIWLWEEMNENKSTSKVRRYTRVPVMSCNMSCCRTIRGSGPASMGSWKAGPAGLISFYEQVTCLVDEGKAVDVIYLNFSKAFFTVSHSILLEKLASQWLREVYSSLGEILAGWMSPEGCGEWS